MAPVQRVGRTELTRRELEILALVIQGKTNRQIADNCSISERTVDNHVSKILHKTGCRKLSDYTIETGRDMGIVRLAQAEVIRAMIQVADNELVSGAVRAIIRNGSGMGIVRNIR
jgi:DNA-binding CsgD family transcriptional regulator